MPWCGIYNSFVFLTMIPFLLKASPLLNCVWILNFLLASFYLGQRPDVPLLMDNVGVAELLVLLHSFRIRICLIQPIQAFLSTNFEKKSNGSKVPRFECSACLCSGNWAEFSCFLKHSCAGRPESKSDAVRRHRLQKERSKVQTKSILSSAPVPLGERALVFGDGFRSLLQKSPPQTFDILQHSTHVCRSLSGFSLPASSGLLRPPILLFQDTISEEISVAATHFHFGQWAIPVSTIRSN